MSIANIQPGTIKKGPTCQVCLELARLPKTEAKALREHLANPAWRFSALSDALFEASGGQINIRQHVLSRHARGQCAAKERLR
jgi:hypothetical protein